MRILFCTDGSDISFYGLDNISQFMKGAMVDIFCVIDWAFFPVYATFPNPDYQKTYEEIANNFLNKAENKIKEKGFELGNKDYVYGVASDEILKAIDKGEYDVVVIGSHGKKGLKSWLGSVSRQVASLSKVPVFISKEEIKNNKKVLFAVDGSECSYNAVNQAVKMMDFKESQLILVAVKEGIESLPVEITSEKKWLEECLHKQQKDAEYNLSKAKSILEDKGLNVSADIILTGNPSVEIIKLEKQEEFGLVIAGSHGRSGLSEFLLGSVSKRILENVNSSVLVVSKSR